MTIGRGVLDEAPESDLKAHAPPIGRTQGLRPEGVRYRHAVARVATLAWALLVVVAAGGTQAAAATLGSQVASGPGALQVSVAPDRLSPGANRVVVRVANTGAGLVRDVVVDLIAPAGVDAVPPQSQFGVLGPSVSETVVLTITGSSPAGDASLVVRAQGLAQSGPTVAIASVGLPEAKAPASIDLVGTDRLSDAGPADLEAVVTNTSSRELAVDLRGDAGGHRLRFLDEHGHGHATVMLSIPAHAVAVQRVRVSRSGRLRRGTVSAEVVARVTAPDLPTAFDVAAEHPLTVALTASDILPGPLGVGTVLLIPGLVALLVWFQVLGSDRRRLGLSPPTLASQVWDNKVSVVYVVGASLLAIGVYRVVTGVSLLDAYDWTDLFVVTAASGAVAWAAATVKVQLHRKDVPVISESSSPRDVLAAAAKADGHVVRDRYKAGDRVGLFVHRDGDAVVLTPPVLFSKPDGVATALAAGDLAGVSDAATGADFDGKFEANDQTVPSPGAYPGAVHVASGVDKIARYAEDA